MTNEDLKEVFLCSNPAYILDLNYNIILKSRSFGRIFGHMFPSKIGDSVLEFLHCWENYEDSIKHVREKFNIGNLPNTDFEPALVKHEKYGLMKMTKMATQIRLENAEHQYWLVQYNMNEIENNDLYWADFEANFFAK